MSDRFDWMEMPDPRGSGGVGTIENLPRTWRHVAEGHATAGKEPWEQWLSEHLAERFVELGRGLLPESRLVEVSRQVSQVVGPLVHASLARPLVLLYDVAATNTAPRRYATWLAILENGAVAIVHEHAHVCRLVTCYFPKGACREAKAERRWRRNVRDYVMKYCVLGEFALMPPEPSATFAGGDEAPLIRRKVEFATPENWGFAPALPGCPWRGSLRPWPAQREADPAKKSHRRLQPRRRYDELGEDPQ